MNIDEYQKLAMRTRGVPFDDERALACGAMGLSGEAGEVTDFLKKVLFHGHTMDKDKVEVELGDVLWYAAYIAETLGLTLSGVAKKNIEKLRKRYPDGFSDSGSKSREE